jgi:hypothetical protein
MMLRDEGNNGDLPNCKQLKGMLLHRHISEKYVKKNIYENL